MRDESIQSMIAVCASFIKLDQARKIITTLNQAWQRLTQKTPTIFIVFTLSNLALGPKFFFQNKFLDYVLPATFANDVFFAKSIKAAEKT